MTQTPRQLFSEQLDRIESKLDKLLAPKRKPVARKAKKNKYDPKFEYIWEDYPWCTGANKAKAYAAYNKRLSESIFSQQLEVAIHMAVISYAELCKATDRTVMLPATFFGPDKHYENDWTIPKPDKSREPKPVYSQSHAPADFSRSVENNLDPFNKYEGM
jgi:hypothetical protein